MKRIYAISLACMALLAACSGAYAQQRFYVVQNATGQGSSWADAAGSLRQAVIAAKDGDEIWVATGTYHPTDSANREEYLEPASGVRLYGGFAGWESDPAQRNIAENPTYIDGNIGNPLDSLDDHHTLMYLAYPDSNTLIDGFIFRRGLGRGGVFPITPQSRNGGAVYIMAEQGLAMPVFRNCVFTQNISTQFGGAIHIAGAGGIVAPRFERCVFTKNHSRLNSGGAISISGGVGDAPMYLSDCTFDDNFARHGGAFYSIGSWSTQILSIKNCVFTRNRAVQAHGGAIYLEGNSSFNIHNCEMKKNAAKTFGMIAYLEISGPGYIRFDSCMFSNNVRLEQPENGAWFSVYASGKNFSMFNSVFFNDTSYNINPYNSISTLTKISVVEGCSIINFSDSGSKLSISFDSEQLLFSNNKIHDGRINFIKNLDTLRLLNSIFSSSGEKYQDLTLFNFSTGKYILNAQNCIFNNIISDKLYYGNTVLNTTFIDFKYDNCIFSKIKFDNIGISQSNVNVAFSHCRLDDDSWCVNWPNAFECGPGNLYGTDPGFVDEAAGDYRLSACSPLVDAGNNAAVTDLPFDLLGQPRIQGSAVDLGPYETPDYATTLFDPLISPACLDQANGALTWVSEAICPPMTYAWTPGSPDPQPHMSGLEAGAYSLTLTDFLGRTRVETVVVPPSDLTPITQSLTPAKCSPAIPGSADLVASGGQPPYQWLWPDDYADPYRTDLPPGVYSVTLTDAQGCSAVAPLHIGRDGALSIMVSAQPVICHDDHNAWAAARGLNGTPPYQYLWDNGVADSLQTDLSPGIYAISVTDHWGCSSSFTFVFDNPAPLIWAVNMIPCTDLQNPDGALQVAQTGGGQPPYQYQWSNGMSGALIQNLAPGIYTLTLTDGRGCSAVSEWEVIFNSSTRDPNAPSGALLWPNPSGGDFYLDWSGEARAQWLRISDANGRICFQTDLSDMAQSFRLRIPADQAWPAGAYLWQLITDQGPVQGVVVRH